MSTRVVAGVDTSTQSCTVELRDADAGALLGTGRAPHPPTQPPVSEHDPTDWWSAFQTALANAAAAAGVDTTDIDAISVAGQCHGLVMLDEQGDVLRKAKLWNDTTSAPQADRITRELGIDELSAVIGSVPTAAFTITKLAWVAEHEPQHLPRVRHILLPHDYLTYRLTGSFVTDRSEASGTGYYSAPQGRYRPDYLERFVSPDIDWASALPQVLGPSEQAGVVSADAGAAAGLRPGIPVGPGAGDQHAGALGLGLNSGDVLFSLGTSGVVMTPSPDPIRDETGWVNGVADATGGYLPLVCTLNCTKVTDAFARLMSISHDEMAALALGVERRDDRPLLAAFLDGERSPNRPRARGLLGGITSSVDRADLALAAYEGVLFGLLEGLDAIRRSGARADGNVYVAGGGARSLAYRQLLADYTGRPVRVLDAPEATARGAALQAAAVLSAADVRDLRDTWRPAQASIIEPQQVDASAVRERYRTLAGWTGFDADAH